MEWERAIPKTFEFAKDLAKVVTGVKTRFVHGECPHCTKLDKVQKDCWNNCKFCGQGFSVSTTLGESSILHECIVILLATLSQVTKSTKGVTKKEIHFIKNLFETLELSAKEKKSAVSIFNNLKAKDLDFINIGIRLKGITKHNGNTAIQIFIIRALFQMVAVEHIKLSTKQEEIIQCFCLGLGYGKDYYSRFKQEYFDKDNTYYMILGANKDDDMEEITKKYKMLVKKFHPDTLSGKDLPQEFTDFAISKFQEIQDAYENIKALKGSIN